MKWSSERVCDQMKYVLRKKDNEYHNANEQNILQFAGSFACFYPEIFQSKYRNWKNVRCQNPYQVHILR